jgi:hypothetical protein
MSDESFRRISKADVLRLLSESKAREESLRLDYQALINRCGDLNTTVEKLEQDFARKTSDLELSMRRELELRKGNESLVNQRTNALADAENWRRMVDSERRRADQEKVLREQMQQSVDDMRTMVDVVKLVAGR